MKNLKLAEHLADASWSTFVRLLEYKAGWNNKCIIKNNRFYPRLKTCCECGYIHQDLLHSQRKRTCPNGYVLDSDLHLSKNILEEGLRIIGAELSDYTSRAPDKTSERGLEVLTSQAHWSLAKGGSLCKKY